MNVTYEKKKAMTFIGYHTEISPDEGYVKCPEFWDKECNPQSPDYECGIWVPVREK